MVEESKKSEYKRIEIKLYLDKDTDIIDYLKGQTLNQSAVIRLAIRTLRAAYGDKDLLSAITDNLVKSSASDQDQLAENISKSAFKKKFKTKATPKLKKEDTKKASSQPVNDKKKPKTLPKSDLDLWDDQNFDNL